MADKTSLIRDMVASGNLILQVDVSVLPVLYPSCDIKDFIYDRYIVSLVMCNICSNKAVEIWPYYNDGDFRKKIICHSCGMCEAVIKN